MIEIHRVAESGEPTAELTLPFDERQKSRLRARLADGREVGLFLPRGHVLRGGDLLQTDDGETIRVKAADEPVSTVRTGDPRALVRAAYHLGNRHVALQIGEGWIRYAHDHVLDEMVRGLGLEVAGESAPFEPEGGAYAHGHSHGGHSHGGHSHGGHSHGGHSHG